MNNKIYLKMETLPEELLFMIVEYGIIATPPHLRNSFIAICCLLNKEWKTRIDKVLNLSHNFLHLLRRNQSYKSSRVGTMSNITLWHVWYDKKLYIGAIVRPGGPNNVTGIHYTWDNWKTLHKQPGLWTGNIHRKYERSRGIIKLYGEKWVFPIQIPIDKKHRHLEFSIYVRKGNEWHWDNNNKHNYNIISPDHLRWKGGNSYIGHGYTLIMNPKLWLPMEFDIISNKYP
jgi:hypothetical protein